ncbi:DUF1629 domain-containing protein [Stenotrophomonas sp. C3(2023)]|uniref:DUF1629 domain-containing protein n=1 Tax=Stenotrophomonas sp. C3(2023) TaxID=3080277 RepID=UPI00293C8E90|nr:DUF1629 domain-containing protein [Stenotrophomonas sp. C3(2023)]MDV3467262.1 DUF1629 domain-containing protein [Stenotrophomonas sp. C3(2023)]
MTGSSDKSTFTVGDGDFVINRPKEGDFYIIDVEMGGPGHRVVFENEDELLTPPRLILRPKDGGFPLLKAKPRLRQTHKGRTVRDLDSDFSGYWLVSEPLKQVFESVDPEGFVFAECEFILHDGSIGPKYYLCDVVRTLDAVDETTSKVKIKLGEGFPHGKCYDTSGGVSLAFRKNVVGPAHVFRTPYNSMTIFCDRVLRDAIIDRGFGKKPNRRGVLLTDASADGIYGLPAKYWPENR